jgi:tRNA pseudouridine13 synthase
VPNLFGPQRFGETRPITHLVGMEMLKGNFEEAVKIFLCKVFPVEPDDANVARGFLAGNWGEFKEAIGLYPQRFAYERSMLDYLIKTPKDFAGALRRLPKRLRKMFLNAVQAQIFNSVAEGVKGTAPLVGYDTVLEPRKALHAKIIKEMEKLGVSTGDFAMESMPELCCTGSEREARLVPKGLKINEISDDEFNAGAKKASISFSLPSGSYATIILAKIVRQKSS